MQLHALLAATALFSRAGLAQVVGSATGFATGVTGGGSAAPVTPADIDELVSYLTDAEPRVILIDKTFDFVGSEGTVNATGCRPDSNTCPGNGGQDAINEANWCSSSYPSVPVTYSKAALEGIHVASDKSIVGVGSKGVIKGRGFRLVNDVSNIIIQNIHITDLNPEYIWGGDAITLAGCDNVWIDHVKFSLIGRQMIVTGYDAAGRVTISNSEFDGTTTNSATCNNNHYWTMLFYGDADKITLQNNYIHDVSGRAPKVGGSGTITMHSVNNLFSNNGGNDFEVGKGASILIEGNVFNKVDTPFTAGSSTEGGTIFNVPDSSSASTCSSSIKRECVVNTVTDSGDFPSFTDTTILDTLSSVDNLVEPMAVSKVESYVMANAGVGKLSSSGSTSSVAPSPSSTASSRRRSHRRHSHARN